MEYQEIVTAYKNKTIDFKDLEKSLKATADFPGRSKYRATHAVSRHNMFHINSINLIRTPEKGEKLDEFFKHFNYLLNTYFKNILGLVREYKAWEVMRLNPREFALEDFIKKSIPDKIKAISVINKQYYKFVKLQKIADLRTRFSILPVESEDKIRKLEFIVEMYNAIKDENMRREVFCFDKHFLHALIAFQRSNTVRIEDFMNNKRRSIIWEYKKFSQFFSTEDFRDIATAISLTASTAGMSKTQVIDCFSDLSESETELYYLNEERKLISELTQKYVRMYKLKAPYEREMKEKARLAEIEAKKEAERQAKIRAEEEKKAREEKAKKEAEEAKKNRVIAKDEGSTGELDKKIEKENQTVTVKEQVNPIILSWLGKDDLTIARRVGLKTLKEFFAKVKQMEQETGIRTSLFIITNANEETTKKRFEDLRAKANTVGLKNLVEGAYGGYSSFIIDKDGNTQYISRISEQNRRKIIKHLEASLKTSLLEEMLDPTEENYLRYVFTTNQRDKSVTPEYLRFCISRLLEDPNIKRQPIKFISFDEKEGKGIDVLLDSQMVGISRLGEYYKSRFYVAPGKTITLNVDNLGRFLSDEEQQKKKVNLQGSKEKPKPEAERV